MKSSESNANEVNLEFGFDSFSIRNPNRECISQDNKLKEKKKNKNSHVTHVDVLDRNIVFNKVHAHRVGLHVHVARIVLTMRNYITTVQRTKRATS